MTVFGQVVSNTTRHGDRIVALACAEFGEGITIGPGTVILDPCQDRDPPSYSGRPA